MKRITSVVLVAVLTIGFSQSARAVVNVGEKPALDFAAADGTPISLAKLKGKIVVVDFWATWCGPCMAEAGHMVEMNKKYNPQGMQMIGISLDSDKGAMVSTAKAKAFAWPQYFDGQGWNNKFAKAWGVDSIPRTFIIGPDGTVLWTGHPGEIDAQIDKAFKQHPPQLIDPKLLADGKSAIEKAKSAMKAGNTRAALSALSHVPPEAKADKDVAASLASVQKGLEADAEKILAGVEPLITQSKYVEAIAKLKELGDGLAGLPAGVKAKKKLMELSSKPEVQAAIAKAERAKQGQAALDVAEKLKADKKDEQAYLRFKGVAKDFTDTDAGLRADAEAKTYEKDPAFVKRVSESAASTKATSTLKLAQSYASAGRNDLARKKYQEVIDQFPTTSYADQARKALDAMPQ